MNQEARRSRANPQIMGLRAGRRSAPRRRAAVHHDGAAAGTKNRAVVGRARMARAQAVDGAPVPGSRGEGHPQVEVQAGEGALLVVGSNGSTPPVETSRAWSRPSSPPASAALHSRPYRAPQTPPPHAGGHFARPPPIQVKYPRLPKRERSWGTSSRRRGRWAR